MYHFDHKKLKTLMLKDLVENGIDEDVANNVVKSLIQTSLRGVDSHGINLFPFYCRKINAGRINKNPQIQVLKPAPCSITVDADHTFGHHAGIIAVEEGIDAARKYGIAGMAVKNSSHFGAASYFGLHAASQDLLCLAFTNADALVKAHGSMEKYFGTNPICLCAPMLKEEPFCLDMATSQVAWNKIREYSRRKQKIPEGLAFDADGQSTIEPDTASMLAPLGGYKGYGLGMMVEILCSLLAGGPIGKNILPMYQEPLSERRNISHYFTVIDVSKYTGLNEFKERLQSMAEDIRKLKTQNGFDSVLIAGDPEKQNYAERSVSGIPVYDDIYNQFLELSVEYGEATVIG